MDNKIYATHASDKTPLAIGDVEIPAYVLSNGMRVLSRSGLQKAIGFEGSSGDWIINFTNSKSISPFINAGVFDALSNQIEFKRNNAGGSVSKTYGYDATILIDICDAIIEAKNAGKLTEKQIKYAEKAELIIRSVAKVGIIALVDEATGYQYDRESGELQKILKAYISEELLPWQKKFPDIFYKELFRLNSWDFTVKGIKKRPGVIGKWTKTLIYNELPKGVLTELEENTPKNPKGKKIAHMHRLLTDDIGNPHLTAQINQIVTLFQLSDNMQHMWNQFEKLKLRQGGQLELPFNFDDKGRTVEPIEENTLSDFDQKLKKGLNYNPKKE
ncbi:P63C domain-containing protein [Wenyingzhuangia sp. 2_MG-2023]|uniref:P63C domain-containing protein n=1 Tax=Wenyingzhuangia sp. 2_MG-2023 TaxID=3062639 RepID=UPI0026E3E80D|nr:P63C domain-containing protein [Wenyingzhuangia sp. 2_MG-2023]MDO6737113.1 P63C domain-containing protein [Wenyingzhuangia sp. 2_MG-2023]